MTAESAHSTGLTFQRFMQKVNEPPAANRFLNAITQGRRMPLPGNISTWLMTLGTDERFKLTDPEHIIDTVQRMIANDSIADPTKASEMLHQVVNENIPISKIEEFASKASKSATWSGGGSSGGSGAHTTTATKNGTSVIERLKTLPTENKVSIGLSCIFAAFSAFNAATRFSHAVETDEAGNRHVNMSNVLMGGVSTLLAVGLGYLAHAQLHVGATR